MNEPTDPDNEKSLIELGRDVRGQLASLRENERRQADEMWKAGKALERLRSEFYRRRDGGDGTDEEEEAWRATLDERDVTQEMYDELTLFTAHHPNQSPTEWMTLDQLDNLMSILSVRPLLRANTTR